MPERDPGPVPGPVRRILTADRVLLPEGLADRAWVETAAGRIVAAGRERRADAEHVGDLLVPGFVDVHAHGGGGTAFDGGDRRDVSTATATHRAHGTTTMVASVVTAGIDDLARSCAALADATEAGLIAGLHLEGPWLSPARAGAHTPGLLRAPTAADVGRLLEASRGHLRMVTIAPELPGALEAIATLAAAGVTVALGHTEATYDQTRAALDAGVTAATHLFNAMRPLHHREPGPVAALLEGAAYVELVADGVHLHPAMIRLAWRPGRTVLVTDAMAAAGMPDGDYALGGLPVRVEAGVARLASGAIAGSTATLSRAVRVAVGAGIPLADALTAATATPAAMVGLGDIGRLVPGARADLLALDADLGAPRLV